MQIKKAETEEYPEVRRFYHSLIDAIQDARYHPKWQKDIYPAPEDLQSAIGEGTLYIGRCGDRIAGAMVVNQKYNEEYRQAAWPAELKDGEFLVIHMLGVHRDFARKGYAKQLVQHAIGLAVKAGKKAVRLDVVQGNLPAIRLYESFGFVYVETMTMFYEDTGWMEFELFELKLTEQDGHQTAEGV